MEAGGRPSPAAPVRRHDLGRVVGRRRLLLAAAVPVGLGLLLLGEVVLARRGPDLPERDPYDLDGRVGPTAGEPLRMVWLGDSTAAGVGASGPDAALPRQVAARLDRPVHLTVRAVSGARVADVRDEQVPELGPAAERADVVVISVGANDVVHLTRRGDFARRYRELLDGLPDDVPLVLLGVPDFGSVTRFAQPLRFIAGVRGGTLDAVISDVARERQAGYVDIAGETGPAFRDDPGRLFAADRYHPSDAGYGLWADAVAPVVEEVVRAGA